MRPGFLSEVFVSFQGEGQLAGRRHLFVRFAGCHLRCYYCDTPDSLQRSESYTVWHADGPPHRGRNPLSPKELTSIVSPFFEGEGPIDGIAVTGGEPLLQWHFLKEWITGAQFPVPILLETSGTSPSALAEVIDQIDIVSMDIKLPSSSGEHPFWNEHDRFARLALQKRLYVKVPVDAGTDPAEFVRAAELVAALPVSVPVFIQPIADAEGRVRMNASDLSVFYSLARRFLADVRVMPQVHKLLEWR